MMIVILFHNRTISLNFSADRKRKNAPVADKDSSQSMPDTGKYPHMQGIQSSTISSLLIAAIINSIYQISLEFLICFLDKPKKKKKKTKEPESLEEEGKGHLLPHPHSAL